MLLYVGRYTEVKRIPLLIRAHARARERFGRPAPLVLLGGFPGEWEGEHPLAVVRETGDRDVFLAGWRGHDDLPDGLNAADLLVLPSVREQFGQVLVEAMACGVPPIAVDAHGPAEIVEDGETGWLVPPDDEDAMVDALVAAASDDAERARRGDAAYEDARARYSWPALARGVASIYDDVLAGRPAAAARTRCSRPNRPPGGGLSSAAVTSIPYRIRRRDRARHARILVGGDGVEVVVPRRFPMRDVEPLRGGEAAAGSSARCGACASPRPSCRRARLEDGGELPYLGERLALRVRRRARSAAAARGAPRRHGDGRAARRAPTSAARSSAGTGARLGWRWRRASTPLSPARARVTGSLQIRGQRRAGRAARPPAA